MPTERPQSDQTDLERAITDTTAVLIRALRALGEAGRPDAASRLAATAWWSLRALPREAERVNGTMHFLTRLPAEPDAPPAHAPANHAPANQEAS